MNNQLLDDFSNKNTINNKENTNKNTFNTKYIPNSHINEIEIFNNIFNNNKLDNIKEEFCDFNTNYFEYSFSFNQNYKKNDETKSVIIKNNKLVNNSKEVAKLKYNNFDKNTLNKELLYKKTIDNTYNINDIISYDLKTLYNNYNCKNNNKNLKSLNKKFFRNNILKPLNNIDIIKDKALPPSFSTNGTSKKTDNLLNTNILDNYELKLSNSGSTYLKILQYYEEEKSSFESSTIDCKLMDKFIAKYFDLDVSLKVNIFGINQLPLILGKY